MRKAKLSHRVISVVLALLMVFTTIPFVNIYAAENNDLGKVNVITAKESSNTEINGSTTTVKFNNEITLDWVGQNDGGVDRGKDGWWVGIRLDAPESICNDYEILSKSIYQSLSYGASEWKTGKSFWNNQDSDKNNTKDDIERYITLWAFVDVDSINKAKQSKTDKNIVTKWQFDWNHEDDSEFEAEQTVEIQIDPSKVILNKDKKQLYPVLPGEVEAITAKESSKKVTNDITTTVNYDNEITLNWVGKTDGGVNRGKDGWWVGIELKANTAQNAEAWQNAVYKSKTYGGKWSGDKKFSAYKDEDDLITLWGFVNEESLNNAISLNEHVVTAWQFDWNNDSIVDQIVEISINPSKVILNKKDKQVYPATALGNVTEITGKPTIVKNKSNSVTVKYDDKVTLQWSKANQEIGRGVDGWWAGIKMTAASTKVDELEKVKYQSKAYGSTEWQTETGKSFWNNQDSDKNNTNDGIERYITLWAYVKDQSMLDNAKKNNEKIVTQWRFDWDNDGVYEQYVNFELDPNKIDLDYTERYKLDTTAPAITVDNFADSKEEVQWSADSATISGTVADSQEDGYASGIKEVYCLNSKSEKIDAFKYENGNFSLTVTEEGELEYTIVATDNSGKEATQKIYAKVDKKAPVISNVLINDKKTEELTATNKNQIVKFSVIEEHSGVKNVNVTYASETIIADKNDDGTYSFTAKENGEYKILVTDKVEKKSEEESVVIKNFDDAAPSASLNKNDDETNFFDQVKKFFEYVLNIKSDENIVVNLTVNDVKSNNEADEYSGIKKAYYFVYSINNNESIVEKAEEIKEEIKNKGFDEFAENADSLQINTLNINDENRVDSTSISLDVGKSVVFVYAEDNAGNVFLDYSNGIVFEKTQPVISVFNDDVKITNETGKLFLNNISGIRVEVQDAPTENEFVSGIDSVTMTVNSGETVELDIENGLSFNLDTLANAQPNDVRKVNELGEYEIVITATDKCGNESTFEFSYRYDTIPPEMVDLSYNKDESETDWSESSSVTFTVTDSYTDKDGESSLSNPKTVEYAVSYDEPVDIANANFTEVTCESTEEISEESSKVSVFKLKEEDVKDGEYTMYVAVKYMDDCGNGIESPIQEVNIKKDTKAPEIDHFELSVEENNAIQNIINRLTHGTYCNESVKLKVYASDETSGLNEKAKLIYNKKTSEDGEVIDEETVEIELSSNGEYYEYTLPLQEKDDSFVYENIEIVVADNYYINEEYPHISTEILGTGNTVVVIGLNEKNEKITEKIENSIIQLENIAPVISDDVINSKDVKSYPAENPEVYNEDLISTITVTDKDDSEKGIQNSGISKVIAKATVNNEETACEFDVYNSDSTIQIEEVSVVYNAKEHTVTALAGDSVIGTEKVGELAASDENKITLTVNVTDNAGNSSIEIYEYTIDNKAPDVTEITSNASDFINDDVYYNFITDERHIKNEGAGVVTYSYNDGEDQTAETDENFRVEFHNEGKYVIKNVVVTDLLGNSTKVENEDFGVKTEFIIDKTAPTVSDVDFKVENNSKNKIINFFKYGIFANDVVTVTATIENTNKLPEGTDNANVQSFTAPLKDAVLSIGDKTKKVKDFVYDSDSNCWTAEFMIALDTEGTADLTVTDIAENTASFAVDFDGNKLSVYEGDVNSGIKFKSEDDKPQINMPQSAEAISEAIDTIAENKDVIVNNSGKKIWFNKEFVLPITVNDTGNQSENAPISGVRSVTITVNDNEYIYDNNEYIYDYETQEEYDNDFDKEHVYKIDLSKYKLSEENSEENPYIIKVSATDFAGNTSDESVLTIYKDINAPTVKEDNKSSDKSIEIDGVTYYSKDFKSTYTVTDNETGIHQVKFDITVKNDSEEITDTVVFDVKGKNVSELNYVYNPDDGKITQKGDEDGDVESSAPKLKYPSDDCVYTVKITAIDNAENNQKQIGEKASIDYHIDNKAPVVTISNDGVKEYTKADVLYRFTTDETHIDNTEENVKVEYVYNESKTVSTCNIGETYAEGSYSITFDTKIEKNGKYVLNKAIVTDLLGNTTELTAKSGKICGNDSSKSECQNYFTIDTVAPIVSAVDFKVTSDSKFVNFWNFGIFANDIVTATVTIKNRVPEGLDCRFTSPLSDENAARLFLEYNGTQKDWKLKNITPNYAKKDNVESGIKTWTAVYTIDLNNIGLLNFETVDKAGNSSSTQVKNSDDLKLTINGGKENDKTVDRNFFLSETAAPIITIEKNPDKISENTKNSRLSYATVGKKLWFNDDVVIPITVVDAENDGFQSGIHKVEIKVNGQEIKVNGQEYDAFDYQSIDQEYKDEKYQYDATKKYAYIVNTSEYKIGKNGEYCIEVTATDYAGNVQNKTFTVYKDTETPYVNFKFNGVGNQDSLKNGDVELVKLSKSVYGYYFVKDTRVTISATDANSDSSSVGVKSITYYAVDINNGIVRSGKDVAVNGENQITFTVPANFKGQIYAYATDFVGNNFSTALVCEENKLTSNPSDKDKVKCVIPDKTIVENAEKHSKEKHVTYQVLTKTSTKDASGYDIYKNAVDVKVTITDTYSGIRNGNVVVTSDENLTTDNDTEFAIENRNNKVGKQINGWTIEEMDDNIVTKISKTIRITRNSNNILISASMEDRAGNKTKKVSLKKFSIDKVAPEITVRYSNNTASDGKYFKANRTATITVKERNFDPTLVDAKVNGKNISLNWSSNSYNRNSNKEGTVYTATITYGSDGDYKFGISCKDRAGNTDSSPTKYTGQTAPTDFVIDKTAPVVTVSNTSTAAPQNTNYYSKPVQVSIKVVEHNWEASKFRITYSENGTNVSKSLSWTNSGDTHTATFTCDSSSGLKYTIDYALADRAANNAVFVQNDSRVSDYHPDEFYVDQTIPEIRFTGAIEGSHNNGTIESGILLSDTYYDRVEVTLTGKRRGVVLQQTYTETNINITEFVETSRDKDDYYTISVVAYDKAGNRNENPVTRSYSVNRKGSMFVLSNDAKKLNDGTTSKNIVNSNIVIYEYNVDKTVSEKVELWKNGNVTKISRGNGYTVSTVENQNGYICNTYSIASNLFADDAAYRIYITTKDEAGNTSTNTKKESAALSALDKNDGSAPVLSFIKDTTPPVIDINLDITKADSYYSIKQDKYVVTFTIADVGSGLNLDSVLVTYGNGNKAETVDLIKNEDGSYSVELKGTYRNLSFTFTDNAGNEFNSLVFNSLTVSANPLVRLVANTPLLIGLIVAFVAIAIIIIILIAKKKKDDDKEENKRTKNNNQNK